MLLLFVKQLVVSSRPGKSLLAIAAVALLFSRPVMGQDKKLIEYGISVPDTFWIENNAALMQTAPLDGTVFDLTSTIAAPVCKAILTGGYLVQPPGRFQNLNRA